jgi:hypothetical protein
MLWESPNASPRNTVIRERIGDTRYVRWNLMPHRIEQSIPYTRNENTTHS